MVLRNSVPTFQLPPDAYLDPAWLERECTRLFDDSWALVADAAELADDGRQLAVVVGRSPIVVVRSGGQLRAFHNICRHRGMTVVAPGAPPCASTLRCPYHGWEWSLDGALRRVPQRTTQFPDLDPDHLGLHPASVAEWHGMVFVHPDADAGPFQEALAGLDVHLGSFRPGGLPQRVHAPFEARFNWKLFVENHIDVYHLWYLHEHTLGDFDHTRFEHEALAANWVSYEPRREGNGGAAPDPIPEGLPPIRHLDPRDRQGIQAHMLFPNTLIAASSGFFATYAVYPVAPDRSRIDLRIRAEPDADPAALVAETRAFIDEDVAACEAIQQAMSSRWFAVGPLARTHERPIADFHTHVLRMLEVA